MTTDDLELVDLDSQIRAAERAGYTATVEEFGGKYSPGWHGILLNPGRIVFSIGQFAQFVADGCKDPARYQAGEGRDASFD